MNSWYEAFGGREIRSGRGGELYPRMHAVESIRHVRGSISGEMGGGSGIGIGRELLTRNQQ
jgi:hypothetical protein